MLREAGSTLVVLTRPGGSKPTGNRDGGEGEACKNESSNRLGIATSERTDSGRSRSRLRALIGPGMDFPECVAYAIIAVASDGDGISCLMTESHHVHGSDRAGEHLRAFIAETDSAGKSPRRRGGCGRCAACNDRHGSGLGGRLRRDHPVRRDRRGLEVAAGLPPGTALLAGERQGLPIPGFDLGNSPGEFTPEVCRDKTLVMTTTNGTRAILASREAERVYIASFTNLRATSAEISVQFLKKHHGHSVHIICAGTEGHVSLEDSLLAGALTSQIAEVSRFHAGFQGRGPVWQRRSIDGCDPVARSGTISRKASVVEIAELGTRRAECAGESAGTVDIDQAAHFDRHNLVAELQRDVVANRGRLIAGNRRMLGWALPRSCPKER